MRVIWKREVRNFVTNPLFYIGAVLVFAYTFLNVRPYLTVHYFDEKEEIKILEEDELSDSDIYDGYVVNSEEEQIEAGLETLKAVMLEWYDISEEKLDEEIKWVKDQHLDIYEISDYFKEKYNYRDADYDFYNAETRRGNAAEINAYIDQKLSEKTYTEYFAVKVVDFLGLSIVFYAIFINIFLFMRDTNKDIYELLHTKPIKPWKYIGGKVLGGMFSLMIPLTLILLLFEGMAARVAMAEGFSFVFGLCFKYSIICILPSLLMVIAVYALLALVFKNPWPSVPLLILYMVYSNMGSMDVHGKFTYILRPLSILTRFPNRFMEFSNMEGMIGNRVVITGIALAVIAISAVIWKRRRL